MEIGPIPGIGGLGPGRLRPREGVWPVDEELEPTGRLEEDSYCGSRQATERSLEEENDGEDSASFEDGLGQGEDREDDGADRGGVDLMA